MFCAELLYDPFNEGDVFSEDFGVNASINIEFVDSKL